MVLSQTRIETAIQEGWITIDPFNLSHLKEASYTFTLQDRITLNPNEFLVAVTKEKITLSKDVCCFLSTRGSIAQQGIDVLQGSMFVEPLSNNQLKLEIKNNSEKTIILEPGTPVVKGVFLRVH